MLSQVSRLKNQLDALYKDMDITKDSSTNMYNNFRDGVKLLIGNKSSVGSVSSVVSRSGKKDQMSLFALKVMLYLIYIMLWTNYMMKMLYCVRRIENILKNLVR